MNFWVGRQCSCNLASLAILGWCKFVFAYTTLCDGSPQTIIFILGIG